MAQLSYGTRKALAKRKVETLIRHAKKERDTKGYRENLGYDSDIALKDYLSMLNLVYRDECEIIQDFYDQCKSI